MTAAQLATLRYLNSSTLPGWQNLDYRVAKKLDDSIPFIGKIQITSTTGGRHASGSMHYKGLAIDFVLRGGQKQWYVFNHLHKLDWKRIGIIQNKNALHVDIGAEAGKASAYLFAENSSGQDIGPITKQSTAYLKTIPGWGTQIPQLALQPGFGGAVATYDGAPGDVNAETTLPPDGTTTRDTALAIAIPIGLIALKIMGA